MRSRLLASALKISANAVIAMALGLLAFACYRRYQDTGSLNWLGLLAVNALFVLMYIAKRDAVAISTSPPLWLLAFAATCLPLMLRPTAPSTLSPAGNVVQLVGLCAVVGAILSLRRSFGIVPANRGVRTQGLYNVVRHPLYATELLAIGGFVLANPSLWNLALWLADCVLQFNRARAEERFLGADPIYQEYRARVPFRLIPRVI
jgi:protein-S-isoprenylcysteine O-methyltransferase Ste14